jgi:pantoate--beta-alanine ligase|tara:strand:- start:3487 stop:4302 length:816 start_codon:yes stop_codon:yes gene_type:complete
MKIFKNKLILKKEISKDNFLSFVPTMGGLHKGHLSLIKKAKKYKYKICVSIFVNPNQFNKKDDFKNYPRNLKSDIKKLKKLKINYLYLPTYSDIYSFTAKNRIYLDKFSKKLCGKFRKDHFEGVINVVNRFLEIVKPKYIYLGLKDFQQLILIDSHIKKNKIKTKVIKCKTIREKNGVACSTRNLNLSNKQLLIASNIYKYLLKLRKEIKKNYKYFKIDIIKKDLISLGATRIDYLEKFDLKNLKKIRKTKNRFRLFIAYYINDIRLIDNI